MKDFQVSQMTKMLVIEAVKEAEDACAEAADQVRRVLMVALKDVNPADADWKRIAENACEGGLVGLLLSKKDIANGAVQIIRATTEAAYELNLDATQMRDSALQGIANIQRFAGPNEIAKIRVAINQHYPAGGKSFLFALRKAQLDSVQSNPSESQP
jgi:hypothetical protein